MALLCKGPARLSLPCAPEPHWKRPLWASWSGEVECGGWSVLPVAEVRGKCLRTVFPREVEKQEHKASVSGVFSWSLRTGCQGAALLLGLLGFPNTSACSALDGSRGLGGGASCFLARGQGQPGPARCQPRCLELVPSAESLLWRRRDRKTKSSGNKTKNSSSISGKNKNKNKTNHSENPKPKRTGKKTHQELPGGITEWGWGQQPGEAAPTLQGDSRSLLLQPAAC